MVMKRVAHGAHREPNHTLSEPESTIWFAEFFYGQFQVGLVEIGKRKSIL